MSLVSKKIHKFSWLFILVNDVDKHFIIISKVKRNLWFERVIILILLNACVIKEVLIFFLEMSLTSKTTMRNVMVHFTVVVFQANTIKMHLIYWSYLVNTRNTRGMIYLQKNIPYNLQCQKQYNVVLWIF